MSMRLLAFVLLAAAALAGCASRPPLAVGPRDSEIRLTKFGFIVSERTVDAAQIIEMLEDSEVPQKRTIHIRVEKDVRDLAPARRLMYALAHAGYRSSVLVTERHAESFTVQKKAK